MGSAPPQLPEPWLADPARFGHALSHGAFRRFKHTDHVSGLLRQKNAEGGARLLVSMPPQCGKSLLVAKWFPAWAMTLFPERRFLVVSYSESIAARSVRAVRDTLLEHEASIPTRLGKRTEDYFETTAGGYVKAAGIGGSITGFGFTDIVIDDPYANAEEAFSAAHRAKVKEAYDTVLMTRLAKGGNVWGIATRWHWSDLFGELTSGGEYEAHVFPAFAHEGDPLLRAPGQALCEALHPAREWKARRDGPNGDGVGAMLPQHWAALYDGTPLREGSGLFKREWVRLVRSMPEYLSAGVRYWDLAASKTRGTKRSDDRDFAVGTRMHRDRVERYVVQHVERLRGTSQDVEDAILRCAASDGKQTPIVIEKEPGSNGEMYAGYLTRALAGWNVTFKPSTGDKETRFRPFASQCQAGNVSALEGAWNGPWFDELETAFVSASHDDQADSASGAFAELCTGAAFPWLGTSGKISAASREDREDDLSDRPAPVLTQARKSVSRWAGVPADMRRVRGGDWL